MGTQVLSPGDCLTGNKFYSGAFSSPKPAQSRRKKAAPPRQTPSPNRKKLNRKSSSPPPSTTSPLTEGFRLLKRGEQLTPAEKPADRTSPGLATPLQTHPRRFRSDPGVLGRFNGASEADAPIESKSGRFVPDLVVAMIHPVVTPPTKAAAGIRRRCPIYAGPAFTAASPEPSSLPVPSFLQKSSSTGSSIDVEATKTLSDLLKINIL